MPKAAAVAFLVALSCGLSAPAAEMGAAPAHGAPPKGHSGAMQSIHDKIQALQARCKNEPKAWEPRRELAELYLRFGYAERALPLLDEAIALKPDDPQALGDTAIAHYQLGHLDEAIGIWTRLASANPKDTTYPLWLERAKSVKAVHDNLARVETQLRDAPGDGALHVQAGELNAKLGKWNDAVRHLTEAVRLLPKDAAARKTYALTLSRVGRMDDAIKELETCVALDPKNTEYPGLLKSVRQLRDLHGAMKRGR